MLGWRGVWWDWALFDESPEEVPLEISNHTTLDGTKPLLSTWLTNQLIYHDYQKSKIIDFEIFVNYLENDAFKHISMLT